MTDPDGGQTTNTYNDTTFALSVTQTKLVTSTVSITMSKAIDDLGRTYHTYLTDPDCHSSSGMVTVDYGYGFNTNNFTKARYTTVSNPYCLTSDSTYGVTTTNYDGLDRVTSVVQADGSTTSTVYAGNTATVTDEVGNERKSQMDGLGRLAYIWEDPAGLNYETDYTYDVLDDVTSVVQKGGGASGIWRTRSFTYDSLARLKCSANPEITSSTNSPASCPATDSSTYTPGTTSYTYDSDSNLQTKQAPAPNQTGTTSTVTTTYTYDQVNRLTSKSYSGGYTTTSVQYAYDGNSLTCNPAVPTINPPDSNPIDHRTAICDASGASAWSHDPMGRILRAKETLVGSSNVTQVFAYTYNLDGSMASLQYPSLRTITYTTNSAGRTISAVDQANSINYLTSATYAPPGEIASFTDYATINGAFSYNSRMQPLQIFYGTNTVPNLTGSTCPSNPGNIMHRVYHFGIGSNDNGNVQEIDNCKDTNRTVFYTFDSLNRVESAATQGTSGCTPITACWGQLFGHMSNGSYVSGYDGWGNLFQVTQTKGSPTTLSQSMTTHNQFSGMTYDAAGNLVNDGQGDTYTYDDENRLVGIPGWSYIYDGDGKRVVKCSSCTSSTGGTLYWYGTGGSALVESNLAGTLTNEYIFFNGRRLARRDNTVPAAPTFYFPDHLGSTSVTAGSAGAIKNESDFYPFGGEVVISDGLPQNYKFTGKERDSESGLDNFGARYNASSMGRFMTPDPLLNSGRPGSPQTWNRYSYALNNPLKIVDPTGLYNLNNTCAGDDKKCNKQFDQNAKRLREGLANLQKRVDKMKDSDQKTRLEHALSAMGTENDGNKVNVSFGAIAGTAAATTDAHFSNGSYTGFDVRFDMSKVGNGDANGMAINAAHEGTHVGDYLDPLGRSQNPATAMDGFQYEYRGYQTSAWAAQALGVSPLAFGNNNVIWNSSWAAADRQTLMDRGITREVTGPPYNYPENPIHDPWPDRFPEPNPGPF
jgi:RHS repeat-associated protein